MKTLLIIFALSIAANAQALNKSDFLKPQPLANAGWFRPFGPVTVASTIACGAGQGLDVASSTGYEANGFLRGANGRMNYAKAIPLKLALCIAPLAFENRIGRKGRIVMRVTQFTIGAVGFFDGVRNYRRRS